MARLLHLLFITTTSPSPSATSAVPGMCRQRERTVHYAAHFTQSYCTVHGQGTEMLNTDPGGDNIHFVNSHDHHLIPIYKITVIFL